MPVFSLVGTAALAAVLTVTAPDAAPPPCKLTGKHPAKVKVGLATIDKDGKTLEVPVLYSCSDATHVGVGAGQPPRPKQGKPKYDRVGGGFITATCDGKLQNTTIKADPQRTFTGAWEKGKAATVGANVVLHQDKCVYILASDVKDESLR
ncbi:hypothetical protein DZF91_11555 [Actinomadura logoneensis]|uniref:Uncharacterized protein n=1 Tax=Actinomadura logoneensis TaxID=2293572 RepID=A0A372JNF8_9ACTN|nr:hypothetical protein [Actinomadura logoneensis]RFU41489.1 hypothetical protein DZF91_11555 [Actinomadura logoneensis]